MMRLSGNRLNGTSCGKTKSLMRLSMSPDSIRGWEPVTRDIMRQNKEPDAFKWKPVKRNIMRQNKEHDAFKWKPVKRNIMRQNKEPDAFKHVPGLDPGMGTGFSQTGVRK
jgi:hypothetical protein